MDEVEGLVLLWQGIEEVGGPKEVIGKYNTVAQVHLALHFEVQIRLSAPPAHYLGHLERRQTPTASGEACSGSLYF